MLQSNGALFCPKTETQSNSRHLDISAVYGHTISTMTSKKRTLRVKLCKIRLYSFFPLHHRHHHHNHHHCHHHHLWKRLLTKDRQRENRISKRQAQTSQQNRHPLLAQSHSAMTQLYASAPFSAVQFNKVSNVLIYSGFSFSLSQSPFCISELQETLKVRLCTDIVRMLDSEVLRTPLILLCPRFFHYPSPAGPKTVLFSSLGKLWIL